MTIQLICTVLASLALGSPSDNPKLPERYEKWLKEEVVYIISEQEQDIFYQLQNNAQRDRFIKEFWEQRDPTPGTEKNEFRDEHYRRIEYANKWLGRETGRPGWKTDRGRLYIQLGEPKQKRSYDVHQRLVPMEMWFYDADPQLGVPPFFYAIFFKKFGAGEYILYDPALHGPESLVFLNAGQSSENAPKLIAQYDFELANASISLLPTEPADIENYTGRPSLGSIQLMAQIENIPNYRRSAEYADRILKGESKVETTYAFDRAGIPMGFHVVRLPNGINMLDYAFRFPPVRLEMGQYKDTVCSALEVALSVMTKDGIQVVSTRKVVDEEYDESEQSQFRRGGFFYEDQQVLLPGEYDVTLTVRNRVSKTFYSITKDVVVPYRAHEEIVPLNPLLFPQSRSGMNFNPAEVTPYQFSSVKFLPLLTANVRPGQEIGIFHQIFVPDSERTDEEPVSVTYRLKNQAGETVSEKSGVIASSQYDKFGTATLSDRIKTDGLDVGTYSVEIVVYHGGEEHTVTSREFTLDQQAVVALPLSRSGKPIDFNGTSPLVQQAEQLIARGRKDMAVQLLKAEIDRRPAADKELNGLYATALIEDGQTQEAIDVLLELTLRFPEVIEWRRTLATLYLQTGSYNKAIGHFERVRLTEGDSVEVLNPLGEAYMFAGNSEKAKEMWELSLRIEENQPQIKSRLDQLQ